MPPRTPKITTTDKQIDAALQRAKAFAPADRRVLQANYDRRNDRICLQLDDGVNVSIPREYIQGLRNAQPSQVASIQIFGQGTGLRWPQLDVDHYVLGLLNQVFGTSQWMAHLGRLGGASRSSAKADAARKNGRKGGRPVQTASTRPRRRKTA